MQFVLMIYQGQSPIPSQESWKKLSDEEQKRIYTQYAELGKTPGLTPGPPLGLPDRATTVRVQDGQTRAAPGPFVDARGAVGGYVLLEAESLEAAVEVAARVPAARLGGAVEVRPVEKYW